MCLFLLFFSGGFVSPRDDSWIRVFLGLENRIINDPFDFSHNIVKK